MMMFLEIMAMLDFDGDGILDYLDLDSDNDEFMIYTSQVHWNCYDENLTETWWGWGWN